MRRAGKILGHFDSDLIFIEAVPTIVVEWQVRPDGDLPIVTIQLDPQRLHRIGWEKSEYMYEDVVDDPRQVD